jgi:uncharacterized RDD family membrane protein YckC
MELTRKVHFITPENIEVSYELAGIGSRFIAAFVDFVIQLLLILVVLLIGGLLSGGLDGALFRGEASLWVTAFVTLASFAIIFGYPVAFELAGAGRTPGKRLVGLRVVRDGGMPVDPYASIIRNLVRIVDLLPPMYGIGLLSIFFNNQYKRLGDIAAGTIVIKERPPLPPAARRTTESSPVVAAFLPYITNVDALSPEEYQLIRRFVDRRPSMDPAIQAHIAMQIALPLMARLGINVAIPSQYHYADLLEAIERRYEQERGLLGYSDSKDPFQPLT